MSFPYDSFHSTLCFGVCSLDKAVTSPSLHDWPCAEGNAHRSAWPVICSDLGVLYQQFLSPGRSKLLWFFLLCFCWAVGTIIVVCHPRLPLLFSLRQLDCGRAVSAPGLVRQVLALGAEPAKWEHCLQSIHYYLPRGSREVGFFIPSLCVEFGQTGEGIKPPPPLWFGWLDCPEPIRAPGLVKLFLGCSFPSKTPGHWMLEQHPLFSWVNLGAIGSLRDLMAVLWGRVSGERAPQISLLALVHLILHPLKVCMSLSINSCFLTKEIGPWIATHLVYLLGDGRSTVF